MYRVRFMPEKAGQVEFHHRQHRAGTERQGRRVHGDETLAQQSRPGPRGEHVSLRLRRRHALTSRLGTTCYVWTHQPDALQEQTLKTLAASPFNKIRFCVFPKRYAWNTNEPPMYPFAGTPRNFDTARFNPEFFQHFERRILDLQKLGIEADIILLHPYDEGHWGFDRMTPPEDDRYLRYVVARLAAFRNVWWSLANEYDFMKQKDGSRFCALRRNRFARTIRIITCSRFTTADDFQPHAAVDHARQHPERFRRRGYRSARNSCATLIASPSFMTR